MTPPIHLRRLGAWTLGFLAFPAAGIVGGLAGPVDDVPAALLGGALTGLVLGAWPPASRSVRPHTIFGSTGAITVTVLAGLALFPLLRRRDGAE